MRKGVSQVISAALLVGVAVAAVGVYSNWLPQFSRSATNLFISSQNHSMNCANADISLDGVTYKSSQGVTELSVENSGTISFRENITVAAVNTSVIIDTEYLPQLETGDSRSVELETSKKPDYVIATPDSCPESSSRRERIAVQ